MSGTVELSIRGMSCNGCASTVTRVLSRVSGVRRAHVELASGRVSVEGAASAEDLIRAVEAAGYDVEIWKGSSSPSPE
jgi:copper chaperone